MSSSQPSSFQGISSCIPSFNDSACLIKSIEFSISSAIFLSAVVLLYQYIKFYGVKGKIYINLALIFLIAFLLINMVYCFWNTLYEFYSIETYFHNLYFLSIVIYTIKSYAIKQKPKQRVVVERNSNLSSSSGSSSDSGIIARLREKVSNRQSLSRIFYKLMFLIFLVAFTLVFVSSLVGDIQSKQQGQNLDEDQGGQKDYTLVSFLKNSCEQLWYICVNGICIMLSIIVLIVLFKNYYIEQSRMKALTLVTTTVHQRKVPFVKRESQQGKQYNPKSNQQSKKINNPLWKLGLWMGLNILGEIINLIESGLLMQANPAQQCRIIPDNQTQNGILMLIFVVGSVYIEYIATLCFFYDVLRQKLKFQKKKDKLLLQTHEYSQEIRVGQIQLNPHHEKSHSSDE